jgi:hypothetical protein
MLFKLLTGAVVSSYGQGNAKHDMMFYDINDHGVEVVCLLAVQHHHHHHQVHVLLLVIFHDLVRAFSTSNKSRGTLLPT